MQLAKCTHVFHLSSAFVSLIEVCCMDIFLQVSWFRASDSQVLSTGWTKFTGDRRVKVLPADRSHSWGLQIRNVTPADTGLYLCQVNTEPKISLPFHVTVTGTGKLCSEEFSLKVNSASRIVRGDPWHERALRAAGQPPPPPLHHLEDGPAGREPPVHQVVQERHRGQATAEWRATRRVAGQVQKGN